VLTHFVDNGTIFRVSDIEPGSRGPVVFPNGREPYPGDVQSVSHGRIGTYEDLKNADERCPQTRRGGSYFV
jgi:hypothetical protein